MSLNFGFLGSEMKKIGFYMLLFYGLNLLASENEILEKYPQKKLDLNAQEQKILKESLEMQKTQIEPIQKQKTIKGSTLLKNPNHSKDFKKNDQKTENITSENRLKKEVDSLHQKNSNQQSNRKMQEEFFDPRDPSQFDTHHHKTKEDHDDLSFSQKWIYGTAVITTTFLDGSIRRSYGVLLRDGMYVTSANMVYDKNYARVSYAMMQDDSSLPFICIAKLSIKALDLDKGLAILQTSEFTDIYCNPREKSYYHGRIYSRSWVDVFHDQNASQEAIVYSPYITPLNSFATQKNILQENLEQLAQKESQDFAGYRYAYGKGFYTYEGKLLGIIGASNDGEPKFIPTKEIANFLCELKERKILKNTYLQTQCSH